MKKESNQNIHLALIHYAAERSVDEDASFSSLLYHEINWKHSELPEIKNLVEKTLEERWGESAGAAPPQIKAFAPGSPVVENIAYRAWEKQASQLLEAGLEKDFRGIVINGRVCQKNARIREHSNILLT